jgi:alcohol dehydrogenase class IV
MGTVTVGIWPNRLVMGNGSMDALPEVLADLGVRRVLVLCGKTVANGELLERARAALGERYCGVFDQVTSHTPLPMVEQALAAVRANEADAIVSIGGGSAIDAGKGVALLSMTGGKPLDAYLVRQTAQGRLLQDRLPAPVMPHIAIPTTSGSASEVMPTAGIRNPAERRKLLFWDDALIPQAVILDPQMAIHTGPVLTAASGMTAVARCVESLYSISRNPLAEGLALHALRLLYRNLPVAVAEPGNVAARYECQVACAMSGVAAINSMVSVVHALGHIVGGKYGLQHGVSHAILLAPSMRRMLPVIGERQRLVLEALGGDGSLSPDAAGAAAADRLQAFVAALPLKHRLRDLGIGEEELPDIALQGSKDYMMVNLPRALSVPEIESLVRNAW